MDPVRRPRPAPSQPGWRASIRRLGERFTCHLGVKTGANRAVPRSAGRRSSPSCSAGRCAAGTCGHSVRGRACVCSGPTVATAPRWAASHPTPPLTSSRTMPRSAPARTSRAGRPWTLFRTQAATRPAPGGVGRPRAAAHRLPPHRPSRRAAVIPLNTCYVAAARSAEEAERLAAWLNSSWIRAVAQIGAVPAAGGFHRFAAGVVAGLPLPTGVMADAELSAIARAGRRGERVQEALDDIAARHLGLSDADRQRAGPARGRRRRGSSLSRWSPSADPLRTGLAAGPAGDRRGGGARAGPEPGAGQRLPPRRRPGCCPGRCTVSAGRSRRIERYRGALLADPVGSGKTYVALAVAAASRAGSPPPAWSPPRSRPSGARSPDSSASRWRSAPTSRRAEAGYRRHGRAGHHRREPPLPESAHPSLPARRAVAARPAGAAAERHAGREPAGRPRSPAAARRARRRAGRGRRGLASRGTRIGTRRRPRWGSSWWRTPAVPVRAPRGASW